MGAVFSAIGLLLAVVIAFGFHQTQSPARDDPTLHSAKKKKKKKRVDHSGHYLHLAKKGISDARGNFWNWSHGWFNDRLNDNDQFPLATIWTAFPLWEAYSGLQIAQPSASHAGDVSWFSNMAETYFNGAWQGYGPYPGSHDIANEIWFDDNAWWGLGFVDAFRATGDRRYLDDGARALRFIDRRGWDSHKHRIRWSTAAQPRGLNLETMGGTAALAAEIYQYTHKASYRKMAHKYLRWARKKATVKGHGKSLYGPPRENPRSYVEGVFIGAHLALCRTGKKSDCDRAWQLARMSYKHWRGKDPFQKPPADTILFRYVLQVAGEKRTQRAAHLHHYKVTPRKLYEWARRSAEDALDNARVHGLFIKFWDGSAAAKHRDGYRSYRYGQLMTHAAPVALLAWLSAVPKPKGP